MTNTVFDFKVVESYGMPAFTNTVSVAGNNDVTVDRPDAGPFGTYKANFTVDLPGPGIATGAERTVAEWASFLIFTVQGAFESWLWKDPIIEFLYKVQLGDADSAIGTGDGSNDTFPLAHRHIDAATLLVYMDGVLQTLTTHYTLEDNNTESPDIVFVSAPTAAKPITTAYEFYHPVKFIGDPDMGDWLGSEQNFRMSYSIKEEWAGAHRAVAA